MIVAGEKSEVVTSTGAGGLRGHRVHEDCLLSIKVYIDGTQWDSVISKNTGKVQLAGAIKTAVPKGITKTFRFVNPDGGETTTTFQYKRRIL